ncbi:MAG: ATP-dependent zinc protease [Synoicihabitans sp.]
MPSASPKIIVGWRESIALPDWKIPKLRAKIDTGAKTSAIDVDQIELLPGRKIRFDVVLSNQHRRRRKWITAKIERTTTIKSSNGEREERYVVSTTLKMGGFSHPAEFTLVRRENMLCRMLIGRAALSPHYVVDPSRTYLTRPSPSKKKKS